MELFAIWQARESWQQLARLRKPPRVAYRLMKYFQQVAQEADICETQRIQCLKDAGYKEGDLMDDDDPRLAVFADKFKSFLQQPSDVDPLDISLDELIDALDAETGNVLSERDLMLLAPFFREMEDDRTNQKLR